MRRTKCPHCGAPIEVRWQTATAVTNVTVLKVEERRQNLPLAAHIMDRLRAASVRGLSLRELQQALKVKAQPLLDCLLYDLISSGLVQDETRGKRVMYVAVKPDRAAVEDRVL